jgi:hypothetical protein
VTSRIFADDRTGACGLHSAGQQVSCRVDAWRARKPRGVRGLWLAAVLGRFAPCGPYFPSLLERPAPFNPTQNRSVQPRPRPALPRVGRLAGPARPPGPGFTARYLRGARPRGCLAARRRARGERAKRANRLGRREACLAGHRSLFVGNSVIEARNLRSARSDGIKTPRHSGRPVVGPKKC